MNDAAVIWDLDGTLLDSYGIIVDSLHRIYSEKGVDIDKKEILFDVINESVSYFIKKTEQRFGIPFDDLKDRYSNISHNEILNIKAMKHAKEILEILKSKGIKNYVFTHRGVTTEVVLKNIGIYDYFDDFVTSLDGYARKPSPDGLNHIIEKHHLNRDKTFYVGDRPMDIKCANNAHIKSIMFIPNESVAIKTGQETYVIKDLLEVADLID